MIVYIKAVKFDFYVSCFFWPVYFLYIFYIFVSLVFVGLFIPYLSLPIVSLDLGNVENGHVICLCPFLLYTELQKISIPTLWKVTGNSKQKERGSLPKMKTKLNFPVGLMG